METVSCARGASPRCIKISIACSARLASSPDRAIIRRLLPRKTLLSRKPPVSGGRKPTRFEGVRMIGGGTTEQQAIAANIDTVFLVSGLGGEMNVRRIERYLLLAAEAGIEAVIVLNKADLEDPSAAVAAIAPLAPGVDILAVSAKNGAGLVDLMGRVAVGRTFAFIGSSGVGKSSLINALLAEDRIAVKSLSSSTGKGRHTTSRRELIFIPGSGILIDTPGLREIQAWGEEEDIGLSFTDIADLASQCRFSDCRHMKEPGCAVRAAVDMGKLDRKRFENYMRIGRELRYLGARRSERLRRREGKERA